jgi:hypothetical protein
VLRIMTPVVPAPAAGGLSGRSVSGTAPVTRAARGQIRNAVAAVDVRVTVEIVIVVDGDVVPAPAAAAAPTAAPECSHHHANAEGDSDTGSVVPRRRVVDGGIGVDRGTVHDHGIVARHVDDLGIGLLNDDDLLGFHDLGLDLLLFVGFEIAFLLSLLAHALHSVHDIALLRQEGVAEVGGPLEVVGQALDHVGQTRQRLNAWIPRLLRHSISEFFVL